MPDRQYPRRKTKQYGASDTRIGYQRPLSQRLHYYEEVATFDTVLRSGTKILLETLLSSLGSVEHIDSEIQDYCRQNVDNFETTFSCSFFERMRQFIRSTMTFGFCVGEKLLKVKGDILVLDDIVQYHPDTIKIRTDVRGRLKYGAKSLEGPSFKSGIYQNTLTEVLLPEWKVIYLRNSSDFTNNYYGESSYVAAYRWHVLKEALVDIAATITDRHGHPLVTISTPNQNSGKYAINPETGESVPLTSEDYIVQQIERDGFGSDSNVLLLPYTDPNRRPEVHVISNANNVVSSIIDFIRFCEVQQTRELLVPHGLLDKGYINNVSERELEVFNRIISSLHTKYVEPYIKQVFTSLIQFAFTRESAKIPPRVPLRKSTRPEDRVAMMQMITGLTETAYLNPTFEGDWAFVRDLVEAPDRELTEEDIEFVKQQLIYPKQHVRTGNDLKGFPGKVARDRSNEGNVKGKGRVGRSVGTSKPQQRPRPRT